MEDQYKKGQRPILLQPGYQYVIIAFTSLNQWPHLKKDRSLTPGVQCLSGHKHWLMVLIFNDLGYAASPDAIKSSRKSRPEFEDEGTQKEKMLISAQLVRYSADSTESREKAKPGLCR